MKNAVNKGANGDENKKENKSKEKALSEAERKIMKSSRGFKYCGLIYALILSCMTAGCVRNPEAGSEPGELESISKNTEEERPITEETAGKEEKPQETRLAVEPEEGAEDKDTLSEKSQAWCGKYFKANDFKYTLQIAPGPHEDRNRLSVNIGKADIINVEGTFLHGFDLEYVSDGDRAEGYRVFRNDDEYGEETGECELTFGKDGSIEIKSEDGAAGSYYSYETLFMREAFERPLNAADMTGLDREEIRLLRNEFYALYGRKFGDATLREFFEKMPWYKPYVEAEDFDDNIFDGVFKRNIDFLKDFEESFDEDKAAEDKAEYDSLPDAPYLDILPEYGEISVNILSDGGHAVDRGLYYEAKGSISLPVTLLPEEYEDLMNGRGKTEIILNELAGERVKLEKSENPHYGDCKFLKNAGSEVEYEDYYFISYDRDADRYFLWGNSADTLFKPVYEGKIYVLKGAEEEYYRYFAMEGMPLKENTAGAFRRMTFDEEPYEVERLNGSSYYEEPSPYSGNDPVFDEKGYLKALYYYGD